MKLRLLPIALIAVDLVVCAPNGQPLCGPRTFSLAAGERVALVGQSGARKTALMNVLLGFLPYQGSLKANGVELRDMRRIDWQTIWVMEAGKLVQQGNWQTLLQQPGPFSHMLKHRQQEIG